MPCPFHLFFSVDDFLSVMKLEEACRLEFEKGKTRGDVIVLMAPHHLIFLDSTFVRI